MIVTIKDIKPSFGIIHSKTEVFIELSNVQFIDDIQCKFGSAVVSAAYINLNQVVCYSPNLLWNHLCPLL